MQKGTKHSSDCRMTWGRKDASCPRCVELMTPKAKVDSHFFGESGTAERIDKSVFIARTLYDLVDCMGDAFWLSAEQRSQLVHDRSVVMNENSGYAAWFTECDCLWPWEHIEGMSPEQWGHFKSGRAILKHWPTAPLDPTLADCIEHAPEYSVQKWRENPLSRYCDGSVSPWHKLAGQRSSWERIKDYEQQRVAFRR